MPKNWELKQNTVEFEGNPLEEARKAYDEGFRCLALFCVRHEGKGAHSRLYRNIPLAEIVPILRDMLEAIESGAITED